MIRELSKGLWWKLIGSIVLGYLTAVGIVGLLGVSGGFLAAAAVAGLSVITAEAFDVVMLPGLVRLLALQRTVGRWSERMSSHNLTFLFLTRLRLRIFDSIMQLPGREILRFTKADVFERFSKDILAIEHLILRVILPISLGILWSLTLGLVFGIWQLEVLWVIISFIIISAMIFPLILILVGSRSSKIIQKTQSQYRYGVLDLINSLPDFNINSKAAEKHLLQLKQTEAQLSEAKRRLHAIQSFMRSILIISIGIFAILLANFLSSVPGIQGYWAIGLVFLVIGSGEIFATLNQGFSEFSGDQESIHRIRPFLQLEDREIKAEKDLSSFDIVLEDVSFAYDKPLITNLALTIREGEHIFLTGASGGGKSTLVYLLAGMEPNYSGQISIAGSKPNEHQLKKHLTIAHQNPYVFRLSLRDNLSLGNPQISDSDIWAMLDLLELKHWAQSLKQGLDTLLSEEGGAISGGQRRRIEIGRALLRNTSILILDEPTEGLDEKFGLKIAHEICKMRDGKTLIWISHRLEEEKVFDRTIII